MTSPWQEWKKNNSQRQESGAVRPWDVVNPNTEYADKETQNGRYDLCKDCIYFTAAKTCTQCGCFMPVKSKLLHAQCPIGKW
jgi:hypothetical protein